MSNQRLAQPRERLGREMAGPLELDLTGKQVPFREIPGFALPCQVALGNAEIRAEGSSARVAGHS